MTERPDLLDDIAEVERVGLRHPAIGPSSYAEQSFSCVSRMGCDEYPGDLLSEV
jgi:hypothetical protein